MIKIFDSQMSLGKNVFGPDSNIEDYLDNAYNMGVVKTIMIPTGTHELELPDGNIERSCIWFNESGKILFKRLLLDNFGTLLDEQTNPVNPYLLMNKFCYESLKKINKKQKKIRFYFCPKIHPILDKEEEVVNYFSLKEVIAFKIQGISSYTSPKDVPNWLIDFIKTSNKPLMIHTDYRVKEKKDGLDKIIRDNRASEWAKWAVHNNLRTYLAHGLCLDPLAIDIVNNSDLFMVGLGPDLMLNQEKNSLAPQNIDYLTYLFDNIHHEKICFNYDYRWNVSKRGNWSALDWESPNRIINCAKKFRYSETFLRNILFYNGINFFNIT